MSGDMRLLDRLRDLAEANAAREMKAIAVYEALDDLLTERGVQTVGELGLPTMLLDSIEAVLGVK